MAPCRLSQSRLWPGETCERLEVWKNGRNVLVMLLAIYTPAFVRKRALRALFECTAAALDVAPPALGRLSADALLRQYAQFTSSQVTALIERRLHQAAVEMHRPQTDDRRPLVVEQRLYQGAVALGQRLGSAFRIRSMEDMRRVGRVLYRMLGIDFQCDPQGAVVISRCFFSSIYSAQVCQVMSAMDCGLFAGLSGGGQLDFSARITEGQPCCRAWFKL